jgi:threonylcarbamoyladenosine tRNA methylthiotransferase MtaB
VLQEVSRAVEAGYREIAITGVHLGSYGRDIGDGTDLARLVRVLSDWPDDVVFRVSSLEPMDCTPAIIDVAAHSLRIAPHFHLPLQHGSDVVLRAMKRPYTSGDFQRVVERVHARLPSAAIGTDVIVGFPGESAEQFAATASLLESLPIAYAHVFPYSDRPGTAATALESKVDGNVIRDRARVLRDVGAAKSREFRRDQVGRVMRALTVDDGASVVTGNYLKVRISNPQPRNTWVRLRIANADPLEGFVTTETA